MKLRFLLQGETYSLQFLRNILCTCVDRRSTNKKLTATPRQFLMSPVRGFRLYFPASFCRDKVAFKGFLVKWGNLSFQQRPGFLQALTPQSLGKSSRTCSPPPKSLVAKPSARIVPCNTWPLQCSPKYLLLPHAFLSSNLSEIHSICHPCTTS